jgi:hypothetical protein
MRDENTMKTGIRILTNENQLNFKRSQMVNWNIYDDFAMKPESPKPFFIRAAVLLGQMDIDGRKVKKTSDYIRTDDGKSMDWCFCKMRKVTPNEIFHAIQRPHKDPHQHVQERRKSRIHGRYRSAINTKKDERPIINIQRGTQYRSYRQRVSEE